MKGDALQSLNAPEQLMILGGFGAKIGGTDVSFPSKVRIALCFLDILPLPVATLKTDIIQSFNHLIEICIASVTF